MPNCIKCGAALPPGAAFCPACGKKQTSSAARPRSRRTRPSGTGSVYRRGKTWECAGVTIPVDIYAWTADNGAADVTSLAVNLLREA